MPLPYRFTWQSVNGFRRCSARWSFTRMANGGASDRQWMLCEHKWSEAKQHGRTTQGYLFQRSRTC